MDSAYLLVALNRLFALLQFTPRKRSFFLERIINLISFMGIVTFHDTDSFAPNSSLYITSISLLT